LLESTLLAPKCSHQAIEMMPTNACQFFYDCKGCERRLLCVLFRWNGPVPAHSEQRTLLYAGSRLILRPNKVERTLFGQRIAGSDGAGFRRVLEQ
jgi:hypothetical protein